MAFPWIVYGKLPEYRILEALCGSDETAAARAAGELLTVGAQHAFRGNLWKTAIAWLILRDENAFSLHCEGRQCASQTLRQAALQDMEQFRRWFTMDCPAKLRPLLQCDFSSRRHTRRQKLGAVASDLAEQLEKATCTQAFLETVEGFYRIHGVGDFCAADAFQVQETPEGFVLQPTEALSPVRFSDLWGYERQKNQLRENTEAFLRRSGGNNVLLYGDAGTGKSTCIKALLNEYAPRGLRLVEINKYQYRCLQPLARRLRERNYSFIFYLDDLSFEDTELEYKYLKAVIEGGIEPGPDNILIYATSNRRHLVRESWSDRSDMDNELHRSDTMQEKLSLSERFGVTINFTVPQQPDFFRIVLHLAKMQGVTLPEPQLLEGARVWALHHGGMSGRVAQQYVTHVKGQIAKPTP